MRYPSRIEKISGNKLTIDTLEPINLERLKTLYGDVNNAEPVLTFEDARKVTTKQRKLFFALVGNCANWSGHERITLENYFKVAYLKKYRKLISLANNSVDSRTDVNNLLELTIDFMFEWDVPFRRGYELLPKKEQWYLYRCCKHRKCAVCGKHSEIHHLDTVGAGNNRKRVDHTKKLVISACRSHHGEAHNIGDEQFLSKYKLNGIYLSYQDFNDLGLMSQKLIDELENKGE